MRHLLLSLLLLTGYESFSQSNFQPGLVVLDNGDTVRGEINNREWRTNPSQVEFHVAQGNTVYTLEQIRYFEISGGERYERFTVRKDMRQIEESKIQPDITDNFSTSTVFLRVLVKGPEYSLYHLHDFKDHFYMQVGDGVPEELIYTASIKNSDNPMQGSLSKPTIFYNYTFRDQINRFFGNEETIRNKVNRAEYRERDLVSVFYLINRQQHKVLPQKRKLRPFIGAGIYRNSATLSSLKPRSEDLFLGHKIVPAIHAGVMFRNTRKKRGLSFMFDAGYSKASYDGTYSNAEFSQVYRYDFKIDFSRLMFSVNGLYDLYKKDNFSIYAGIGLGYDMMMYKDAYQLRTNVASGSEYREEYSMENGVASFLLRAGVEWGRMNVSLLAIPAHSAYSTYTQFQMAQTFYGVSARVVL